jgi:hypothetical protein
MRRISGVQATVIGVFVASVAFVGVAQYVGASSYVAVTCNPKGTQSVVGDDGACWTLKASCKGAAQSADECVIGTSGLFGPGPSVISFCGDRFCAGQAIDVDSGPKGTSFKASCKWEDGAGVKGSFEKDTSLCVPCCVKPPKGVSCAVWNCGTPP